MPEDIRKSKQYARFADGLILTHGPDIHRGRYGRYYTGFRELKSVCSTRDDFEFTLFREFSDAKKPVLGIGRGMQIINAASGGTLHLPDDRAEVRQPALSEETQIRTEPHTGINSALGDKLSVNLLDYQKVERLGLNLRPAAFTGSKTVEALEHEFLPISGIGWNPLNEKYAERNHSLFEYFIQLCKGDEKKWNRSF